MCMAPGITGFAGDPLGGDLQLMTDLSGLCYLISSAYESKLSTQSR
jgi:hypothetical protein